MKIFKPLSIEQLEIRLLREEIRELLGNRQNFEVCLGCGSPNKEKGKPSPYCSRGA